VTSLVFDTTALSHFARAGRTDELRVAVADDEPVLLAIVDDLIGTGMRLPVGSGASLFAWAYEDGILP
jgi:hypothetical protein